ncbi:MAG: hypothetical protein U1F81_14260 [Verrucomicrobiaceae bacterium]|jgi:hypothetical protein
MRHHADFFRGQLAAAFGQEPLASIKLSEWVNSGSASLTSTFSPGYPLVLQSLTHLRPFFAFEGERFSSAALESFNTALSRWTDPEDRDGLAWKLVSLYYSAYYSAHAILRLSGVTVTQIDSWSHLDAECRTLYASTHPSGLGLQHGYHVLKLDGSGTALSVDRARVDSTHGSHTALWSEFKQLADASYANNAFNTSFHVAAVGEYSQKVSKPLVAEGRACNWPWMPVMRNQINYRLPEKIWGTHSKRITPSVTKRIHSLIGSPKSDAIFAGCSDDSEWIRFAASCVYMVCLLSHLIRESELRARSASMLPSFCEKRKPLILKLCCP